MSSMNSSSAIDNKRLHCADNEDEENISESFICCVCLDLLYKPIVLDCGHVSCFWCVHKSMDPRRESHCPVCRNPYHHFPTICEMLHFLLLKLYPVAYKRREKQILEEEKEMGLFSPQLDVKELNSVGGSKPSYGATTASNMPSAPCCISEDKGCSEVNNYGSAGIEENKLSPMNNEITCNRVRSTDVLCPVCKQLLFRPAVLNCGHVYCQACITAPDDGIIMCKVCESPHPSDFPNVCLEFNNFLEEHFPGEYAARRENGEHKEARFEHKNTPQCSSSEKSAKKGFSKFFTGSEAFLPWSNEHGSKVHIGAGCDYCGMYPIVGDRYRCQDCVEQIGFDLCGDCYNTSSKRPGRFNQQHTPDHRFELVKPPDWQNIMLRLVGDHLVDSSGTPVIAISAIDDSTDGWVAIDSFHPVQDTHNNAVVPEVGESDIINHNNEPQEGSTPMEFSDAPEIAGNYGTSIHEGDNNIDDGNNSSSMA